MDTIIGSLSADSLIGGNGSDLIYGGGAEVVANDIADYLRGGGSADTVYGNGGNDLIFGDDNFDYLYGGFGDDTLYGGSEVDSPADGSDFIVAGPGADSLIGGYGDDTLYGGNKLVDPTDSADVIDGGYGNDIMYGNGGNDSIIGGDGNDTLYGGLGDNILDGGDGDDVIYSASEKDVLTGGDGVDTFIVNGNVIAESSSFIAGQVGDESSIIRITDLEEAELIRFKGVTNLVEAGSVNGETVLVSGGKLLAVVENVSASDIRVINSSNPIFGVETFVEVVVTVGEPKIAPVTVNSAPVLSGIDDVTFLENTVNASAQLIDIAVSFADDNANLNGGNLTITYSVGGGAEDSLSIANIGSGAGQIGFDGANVSYAGTVIGSINGANNGAAGVDLIIDFNSNATPTVVEALIEALTYANSSDTPTGTRTISATVNDGSGATSAADTAVITVTPESDNSAPVLSGFGNVTFLENTVNASAQLIDNSVSFTDDNANLNGGKMTVSYQGGSIAEDYLYIRHEGFAGGQIGFDGTKVSYAGTVIGSISGADNGASGVDLVIDFNSNATPVSVDALIENLTYYNTSDTPTAIRKVSIVVNDGAGANSGASTARIDVTAQNEVSPEPAVNITSLNGTNGFSLLGRSASDTAGISVSSAGDINGDGYDDIIVGANGLLGSSGGAYVIFGDSSGWASSYSINALADGSNGFLIRDANAGDLLGTSVSSAGDINGDGYDDMIVGANAFAGSTGVSYVLFGAKNGWASSVSVNSVNGTNGFRIVGANAGDEFGVSVSSAGDINGDGYDDMIVGANEFSGSTGASYVVFGANVGWAASISVNSLNGANGFRIVGRSGGDEAGISVSSAGDFNGDGYYDMIVGANGVSGSAGAAYVLYGTKAGWAATVSVASLNGTNGFSINGRSGGDEAGISVSSAGDINGDGYDDIIVGANGVSGSAGAAYVLFGSNTAFPASFSVTSLTGARGFRLDGIDASDAAGISVSSAGDFNGDGLDDMIVGANVAGSFSVGESYIIYGKDSYPSSFDLADLDGSTGFRIDGNVKNGETGTSVSSVGDVNGDGFDDVIIGGPKVKTAGGNDAGAAYILFGNNDSGAVDAVGTVGADTISGSVNSDVFVGGEGSDLITGFDGDDVLKGANGKDVLFGHDGSDTLIGGNNNDTLIGGAGADVMYGDGAIDTFDFNVAGESSSSNLDVLHINFDEDRIDISDIASENANTINSVTGVAASSLNDVLSSYNSAGIDRVGDANMITVGSGSLIGSQYLIISTDGNSAYNEGVDLFMQIYSSGTFDVGDII